MKSLPFLACLVGCAPPAVPFPGPAFETQAVPLPGANGGPVALDYLASDDLGRVWVPAGGTGSVDVFDGKKMTRIEGFATLEVDIRGQKHLAGPSAVAIGDGVAYIGSRADSAVCVVDARSLTRGTCFPIAEETRGLATSPDGLVYVAATKELWVTVGAPTIGYAPAEPALRVLDAKTPATLVPKGKVALPASAEGYAVDDARGVFYTNLEENGRTVAIDVRTRAISSTWDAGCGSDVRGLALDAARGFLFVACTTKVVVLDAAHDGRVTGTLPTGDGVDNIAYAAATRTVYAAAGRAARLTMGEIDDAGRVGRVHTVPTPRGARVVVADSAGTAYVADPLGGRLLVVARRPVTGPAARSR
jgi:DNA-binding beta-propeller fold protein YncE